MSEDIHNTVLKEVFQEIIGGDGVNVSPHLQSLYNNYIATFRVTTGGLNQIDSNLLRETLKTEGTTPNLILKVLKSPEVKNSLYKKSYDRLKAFHEEGKSWEDLFSEVYSDEPHLNEIFVRLIEEEEKVTITSAKQLQELTGITEIYGYWDEEKGKTVFYGGGDKEPTKEKAQEVALYQIEDTFTKAMIYRYSKALEDILQAGGKYSDLLQIKPEYFNLPETWSGWITSDQYSSILWAIEHTFLIGEPDSSYRPDLKAIAQEIGAPYSVLMDAHKICN